ncbi:MAG: cytosine specific DNA methyltransferase (BSP6IM) [uncultured Sulfurovum sp.]|uniref:DNA (cytosine-5-)-methyltransferase n=1 Tax=uncultured Sulfurovum sp. TaxID=269237 RepID=A0A6S6T9U6_9BACT|nr:MAG: cytosine specific DNA methyltransferase (BSP6IM) [uncultured Sulfurovum sp.]
MQINPDDLPNFDFMVGGFPCQTFSIIGTRCGLDDEERGQIIYGLVKILKAKDVKYFILENVKGLINHDKGNTLKVVLKLLDNVGYRVYHEVLNSLGFAVPQMRERIYFVGVKKELVDDDFKYEFPKKYADSVRGKISNQKLLQQTGNSVIEEIAKSLMNAIGEKSMTEKEILINRGSTTAKNGFKNEVFVVEEFNNWKESEVSQSWLKTMSYNLNEIESVKATKVKG